MKRLAAAAAVFAFAFAVAARAEMVDRVAAVVNNDIIALSEVEQRAAPELAKLATERDPVKRGELRNQIMHQALDQLIGEKLIDAEMRELNIDVTDGEIDYAIDDVKKQNNIDGEQFEQLLRSEGYSMSTYRTFIKKHLARTKLINLKVRQKVKVSDEDVKAECARINKMESEDAEVHARHILIVVKPDAPKEQVEAARKKAQEIADEARKPGVDFAELAKKRSEGPTASEGGDLGFFRRGVMVPDFEKAAFNTPVGGISDPIRTRFGWHVLKIEEKRAVATKSCDDLKDQIKDKLLRGQMEKYTEQYVQELRAAAVVEVKI